MCLCRRLVATRFPGGDGSCRRCDEARIESCMFLAKAQSVRPSAPVPSQRSPPGDGKFPSPPILLRMPRRRGPTGRTIRGTHGRSCCSAPAAGRRGREEEPAEKCRREGAAGMNRAARSAGASSSAPPRARRRPALRARCQLTRGARTRGGKPEKREAPPGPRRRAAGRPCTRADPRAGGPVGEGERATTSSTTRGWSYSSCPTPASNPPPARVEEKPTWDGVAAMARARWRSEKGGAPRRAGRAPTEEGTGGRLARSSASPPAR
jgi:hypothetical protein